LAYSPAGNTTGSANLAHLASVYYNKTGLDRLEKKFIFRTVCTDDVLPKQVGKTVQWFRYTNLTATPSPTPTTEGVIGSSLSPVSKIISATVSQYTSFITVSDLLEDTALDPVVANHAGLLGYQGGLTVDNITRTIMDNEYAGCSLNPQGTYLKVADLRNAATQLSAVDVEGFNGNNMKAVMHPFAVYDVVNDPAAGGLADIRKFTSPGILNSYDMRGEVTTVGNCDITVSTNVKVVAGSPNTYATYIFGKGAIGAVDLAGRGPNKVSDPKKQRFGVKVIRGGNSIADPEGVIGAAVSYNFVYTAVVMEGPAGIGGSYRMKQFRVQSSIG
jgi:N4-gp56 family major capsid protein